MSGGTIDHGVDLTSKTLQAAYTVVDDSNLHGFLGTGCRTSRWAMNRRSTSSARWHDADTDVPERRWWGNEQERRGARQQVDRFASCPMLHAYQRILEWHGEPLDSIIAVAIGIFFKAAEGALQHVSAVAAIRICCRSLSNVDNNWQRVMA